MPGFSGGVCEKRPALGLLPVSPLFAAVSSRTCSKTTRKWKEFRVLNPSYEHDAGKEMLLGI